MIVSLQFKRNLVNDIFNKLQCTYNKRSGKKEEKSACFRCDKYFDVERDWFLRENL